MGVKSINIYRKSDFEQGTRNNRIETLRSLWICLKIEEIRCLICNPKLSAG